MVKPEKLTGRCASPGLVKGFAFLYGVNQKPEKSRVQGTAEQEWEHFEHTRAKVRHDITELLEYAQQIQKKSAEEILSAQLDIVCDPELESGVRRRIFSEKLSAHLAIKDTIEEYISLLEETGSDTFRERIVDLRDLQRRLLTELSIEEEFDKPDQKNIVIARDLSPTEIMDFIRRGVKGFVLEKGGIGSHAAIVAHAMQIPMLINAKEVLSKVSSGGEVFLNAGESTLYVNPGKKDRLLFETSLHHYDQYLEELAQYIDTPSKTRCGISFDLHANIEILDELPAFKKWKASGVGLLRTESQFLLTGEFPSQVQQQKFYTHILKETSPREVTVRLFDVGGDKLVSGREKEPNPFLGWRGIRILLDRKELLREQLYAILGAAKNEWSRVRILIPMISDLEEFLEVKKELADISSKLGLKENSVQLGIMVEVPSVLPLIHEFAAEVDFMSIGTNDLTQYLLAIDRGNSKVGHYYEPLHPSVLKSIDLTLTAAAQANINCSVCGEMASNPLAAKILLGMGCTRLSMSPASIPIVKQALCESKIADLERLAEKFLKSKSLGETNRLIQLYSNPSD